MTTMRRPCLVCGVPSPGARCPRHQRPTASRWPDDHGAYDYAWTKLRNAHKAEHPNCQYPGCSNRMDEVDHIVPVRVDPSRRLDRTNLVSLCLHHHRSKSARASNTRRSQ